jgi:predicted dehydrogenase
MTGIGMVGAGKWGGNWLKTLASLPEVSLRWVCDLNEDLLKKIKEQYPQVQTTTSYDDLLEDPETQGIVLATIAPTHFSLGKRALEAGKHVLVEKPMTLTTTDAVELNRIAHARRRVLMVGHLMEYHPAVPAIKELIDSGAIGEVTGIECVRRNLGTIRADENAWWSFAPHDISICLRLMGEWPSAVMCFGQNMVQPKIADVVNASLTFPSGRKASVEVSWHSLNKVRLLTVYGTKKWIIFDDTLKAEIQVKIYDTGFAVDGKRVSMRNNGYEILPVDATQALILEAKHFAHCISTNTQPLSDGESGAAVVSVLEYGQQSLDQRREVMIPKPDFNGASRSKAA